MKFFCKTYVMYIKRKLRTCRIQIQEEKVWFLFKKDKKMYFFEFFLMSEQSKKIFFWFFQNFNFFLKNTPRGPRKCEKKQSHEIWAYLERPQRCHARSSTGACTLCPPPCSIGLKVLLRSLLNRNQLLLYQNFQMRYYAF